MIGLTDEGFTLRIEGQGETVDTIVFEGAEAVGAITERDAGTGNFNRKDGNWGFDVFDVATESSQNVTDNASFGFGNTITPDEVLALFDDLTSGNARQGDTGIDGVELIGLNDSSFSVAVTTSGGNKDFILFTNVNTLEGSDAYGFDAPVLPLPVDDVPSV